MKLSYGLHQSPSKYRIFVMRVFVALMMNKLLYTEFLVFRIENQLRDNVYFVKIGIYLILLVDFILSVFRLELPVDHCLNRFQAFFSLLNEVWIQIGDLKDLIDETLHFFELKVLGISFWPQRNGFFEIIKNLLIKVIFFLRFLFRFHISISKKYLV